MVSSQPLIERTKRNGEAWLYYITSYIKLSRDWSVRGIMLTTRLHPPSAQVKNAASVTSIASYVSLEQCTIKHCDNLHFHITVCDRRICVSAAARGPPVTESYSTAPICTSHCYVRKTLWWSGRICSFGSSQHAGSHNSLQLWRNTAKDFRMTGQFYAQRNSQVAASGPSINITQLRTPRTTWPTWLHFHRSGVSSRVSFYIVYLKIPLSGVLNTYLHTGVFNSTSIITFQVTTVPPCELYHVTFLVCRGTDETSA